MDAKRLLVFVALLLFGKSQNEKFFVTTNFYLSALSVHAGKPIKFIGGHTNEKEFMEHIRFSFDLMDQDGVTDTKERCINVSIKLMRVYGDYWNCFAAHHLDAKYIKTNKWLEFIYDSVMEFYVFRAGI